MPVANAPPFVTETLLFLQSASAPLPSLVTALIRLRKVPWLSLHLLRVQADSMRGRRQPLPSRVRPHPLPLLPESDMMPDV